MELLICRFLPNNSCVSRLVFKRNRPSRNGIRVGSRFRGGNDSRPLFTRRTSPARRVARRITEGLDRPRERADHREGVGAIADLRPPGPALRRSGLGRPHGEAIGAGILDTIGGTAEKRSVAVALCRRGR
jgi:hypothetical protein